MVKESKKNLESVEALQKEILDKQQKIRTMKRADSEVRLQLAVEKMSSEEINDQKEILDACYDYIAQHRALFRDTFKKLE